MDTVQVLSEETIKKGLDKGLNPLNPLPELLPERERIFAAFKIKPEDVIGEHDYGDMFVFVTNKGQKYTWDRTKSTI